MTQPPSAAALRRLALLSGLLFLVCAPLAAHESGDVSLIRIFIPDRARLADVWATGIDHEGASGKPGGWMEFVAAPAEREELARRGMAFETVIADLAGHYAAQMSAEPVNALGFGTGSMGGYYTYTEIGQQLDSMAALYPGLITTKQVLGTTTGGRSIWLVKISDNASVDEPSEPEALYTALHHAREPQGMMTVLYYMWWLLENYAANPEAAYLVNNRQLWFIPVVNPDGYAYNQATNPSGGGMWRKNRRNNGGSYGVDLNRNYGPVYMWDAPNGGSSTTPSSDTYRGPAAFSEPETQAIDAFLRTRQVRTALNYHTYGNYLIYPYGYRSGESEDSLSFRDWTFEMTRTNRYVNGTDLQTVNYSTRGNSDDSMYGDSTKPRTFAMTPEVGPAFWPSSSQILPLAIENLRANMLIGTAAGQSSALRSWSVNGPVRRSEAFQLSLRIRNGGLGDASSLTVSAAAAVPWLSFPAPGAVDILPARSEATVLLDGVADSTAPGAGTASVVITCTDPEGYVRKDTLRLYIGAPATLFADSASAGTGNWTTGSGWGITTRAHTPPGAFTDSPSGNYASDADNSLTLTAPVSLAGMTAAALSFRARWAVEPAWDAATVEVSTNNGSSWIVGRTAHTRPGSGKAGSRQPSNITIFDSYSPGNEWSEEVLDLTPYAGQSVRIRFRLAADGAEERDGFYVDDIRILGYADLPVPPAPALLLPPDAATGVPADVQFSWTAAAGALAYQFQLALDSAFTQMVTDAPALTAPSTLVQGLASGVRHYWRARTRTAGGWGPFAAARSFSTQAVAVRTVNFAAGWNMVALPLMVADPRTSAVFPGAASPAYAYALPAGYSRADTLAAGTGYWIKWDSAAGVPVAGEVIGEDTLQLQPGWNLIGGISSDVDTALVVQNPPGVLLSGFLGFDAGYTPAAVLEPGRAYWVKAAAPGTIILRAAGAVRAVRRNELRQ